MTRNPISGNAAEARSDCSKKISMKLYVGNLSVETTGNDLKQLFQQYGQVSEVALRMAKITGKSRGFAFVTMNDRIEAETAIAAIDGRDLDGRALSVSETRARKEMLRPYGATRSFHGSKA